MLRLAYTSHTTLPSTHTSTQQIFWTLSEVARRGMEVCLVVPRPASGDDGPAWRRAIAGFYGDDAERWPPSLSIAADGRPSRTWIDEVLFDLRAGRRFPVDRFDLMWTRDYVAAAALVGAGRPTVFETYRPDLATRARYRLWRGRVLRSPHLRGLIVHSRLSGRAFLDAGVDEERCLVAYNGFAPTLMGPRLDRQTARRTLGLPLEEPLVVYTGHAGKGKGVEAIVALAGAVPEARFMIVGADEGTRGAARLARLVARASVRNLDVRPRVPASAIAGYRYAADCLLVPLTDEPLRRYGRTVLPIKVFEYLATGRAILAPQTPDIEEVLTDGVSARLVPPTDVRAGAEALRSVLADEALRDRLAEGALAASGAFTWAARAGRLVPFLERLAAR